MSVDVVLDLAKNLGQGYNITGDKFFTSVVLVELLKRKISYVGNISSNRRELCPEANKRLQLHSTKFLHHCSINVILVTYQGKNNKSVELLSSMHRNSTVMGPPNCKPEVFLFYNKNKVGVDAMDQMIRACSTRTASRRWTFAVFCNILDKSVMNSWIIYRKITQTKVSRRDFIYEVFIELTTLNRTGV